MPLSLGRDNILCYYWGLVPRSPLPCKVSSWEMMEYCLYRSYPYFPFTLNYPLVTFNAQYIKIVVLYHLGINNKKRSLYMFSIDQWLVEYQVQNCGIHMVNCYQIYFFFNVYRLPTCMSVHHVHAWYLQRPERGSDPLELDLWTVV